MLLLYYNNSTTVCNSNDIINSYHYGNIDSSNDNTQAVYATEDKGNPSSSEDEDCSSDELPASIDGTIRCMEHYSYEFEERK